MQSWFWTAPILMDVAGMVADLRLELDRIERSILILEELVCPHQPKWPPPVNRVSKSPVRSDRVISIERRSNRPERAASPLSGSPEGISGRLGELRIQTLKFRQAISALVGEPGD
jgi:hypothetical protein